MMYGVEYDIPSDITKTLGRRGNLPKAISSADELTTHQLSRLLEYLVSKGYHSTKVPDITLVLSRKVLEGDLMIRQEHYDALVEDKKKYIELWLKGLSK